MVSAHQPDRLAVGGSSSRGVPLGRGRDSNLAKSAVTRVGAVLEALDGRALTRGTADIVESGAMWTARLTQLDRPGVIASVFFAERARDVVLRLDDGRSAPARISSTSFIAASERVCDLTGIEPFV